MSTLATLTPLHKHRLARTAIRVLRDTRRKFNMKNFAIWGERKDYVDFDQVKPECGTSCCIIGFACAEFLEVIQTIFPTSKHFVAASEDLFGIDSLHKEWFFLFRSQWPNCRLEAAARVLHFLEGGKVPEADRELQSYHIPGTTKQDYIQLLHKFVLSEKQLKQLTP